MHRVTQQQHIRAARPWLAAALLGAAVVTAVLWTMRPHAAACRTASTAVRSAPASAPALASPTTAPNPLAPNQIPGGEQRDAPEAAQARYYAFAPTVSCSFPNLPLDGYYVGVPTGEFAGGAECGSFVDLEGPLGAVRAEIVDRCPGCGPHQYDLSTAAYNRIADPRAGVAEIRLIRIHNPDPAPELTFRVQNGSSASWIGLLFADTGNALSRVEIRPDSGGPGHTLSRGPDNYWRISGAGPGPFTALLTDTDGHQAEVPGITVTPGQIQHTDIQLYRPPPPIQPTTAPPPVTTVPPAVSTAPCA
ncbi:hypothetical protein IU500_21305 [Nocardia terpenica]|uniref:expansin EXLX1 family cellulose-binding protein n=1 Tax=Nocardia terpenica TaxID=455432 RepID=UPI001895FA4D|nr:expansin EXLX1 family cellulose-binding protein [Nocardia terpenica]MBF6064242.1 hypothetical protein [Nocardia terpenica]MBF6106575.1 hypothetical protein [Nocardia terpenica]MBF6113860.1 hypothetical protein [Nocardia terpenica]MBF6120516.1 hypothetical protein [Nocardia terpenica]MBF6154827.1 hypothetical protein [Nocardia terpenica]